MRGNPKQVVAINKNGKFSAFTQYNPKLTKDNKLFLHFSSEQYLGTAPPPHSECKANIPDELPPPLRLLVLLPRPP